MPTVRGVERVDDRRVISGIVHVLKSGCRWCDCPPEYGPAMTIYNRFVRWAERGIWENLFRKLAANGRSADTQMIDSTHVKAHRSAYLALGGDFLKGMGGSMHLYDPKVGFHGSAPIVAVTISIATGAGLACKMDGKGTVAVSYFGDGAAEEGSLHESLNMASVMKLSVLFVCENNLFSSHLDIELRQPLNSGLGTAGRLRSGSDTGRSSNSYRRRSATDGDPGRPFAAQ